MLMEKRHFLPLKALRRKGGIKRNEWEYEIPVGDAEEMLLLCEGAVIDKIRYLINYEGLFIEVDEFYGSNEGLVIAEIELERR